jgi:hypothetical protein
MPGRRETQKKALVLVPPQACGYSVTTPLVEVRNQLFSGQKK